MPIATQPPSAPDTATAHNSITLNVLVALPAHTPLAAAPLHYLCSSPLPAGTLVRVPLGKRQVLGIVWDATPTSSNTAPETSNLKHIAEIELLENGAADIVTRTGKRVPVSRRHLREIKDKLLIS